MYNVELNVSTAPLTTAQIATTTPPGKAPESTPANPPPPLKPLGKLPPSLTPHKCRVFRTR